MRMRDSAGEGFYHEPSDKFVLRAEAWLGSRMGMRFWKPLEWLVHVIFHDIWTYELSQAWDLFLTILPVLKQEWHLLWWSYLWSIIFYCWWLKSWEDCIIKRAKPSYWWRIRDLCSPIYYQTFDMSFSTRCFWVEDFDVLSVDIWLECESHCQVKRTLHVDICWWYFPGHHCNWQIELWELCLVYPDEVFFWF